MENTKTKYRVNSPTIVHEEIDGEAVIVNMENGSYYSLDDSGALIWSLIEQGMSARQAADLVAARYTGPEESIREAVNQLIEKLVEEQLVLPDGEASGAQGPPLSEASGTERAPFQSPVLRKYTDMEELLLLDPIHENNAGDVTDEASAPNP